MFNTFIFLLFQVNFEFYAQLAVVEEDICALADCIEYSPESVGSPTRELNIGGVNYPPIEYGDVLTTIEEAEVRYPIS